MEENKTIDTVIDPEKGVSSGTIARTICLVLALANQILAMLGLVPVDIAEDTVYQGVSIIFTVVTAGIAWWKNNSFSKKAIAADQIKDQLG